MDSVVSAPAGDTIADFKTLHSFTQGNDRPRGRITGEHRLIKTIECRLNTAQDPFPFSLIQHLFDQIRTGNSFGGDIFFGKFNQRPFRTRRNQGKGCLHESISLPGMRDRKFFDTGFTIFHVLKKLFH